MTIQDAMAETDERLDAGRGRFAPRKKRNGAKADHAHTPERG